MSWRWCLIDEAINSRVLQMEVSHNEAVWALIRLSNGKTVSLCSFYRPPSSTANVLYELIDAVETVKTDYVIIGGDFNLPEVNWAHHGPTSSGQSELTRAIIELCGTCDLTQMVLQPTRGNIILDLMLMNTPTAVKCSLVLPGISDHAVVHCELNLQYAKIANCARRRIYSYQKARKSDIESSLDAYYDVFETLAETENADELWNIFKLKLLELRDRYVPSWIMTPRRSRSKPWCTKEVRGLARKRATAYTAYRKTPSSHLRKRLEVITKHMKSVLSIQKKKFFGSFGIGIQRSPKKLWQLVKLNGKDSVYSST